MDALTNRVNLRQRRRSQTSGLRWTLFGLQTTNNETVIVTHTCASGKGDFTICVGVYGHELCIACRLASGLDGGVASSNDDDGLL